METPPSENETEREPQEKVPPPVVDPGPTSGDAAVASDKEDPASEKAPGHDEAPSGKTGESGSRGHTAQTHVEGDHNNLNLTIYGDSSNHKRKLIDCLTDLPGLLFTDATSSAFRQEELQAKADLLRRERLLLLSCSDTHFLFSAVHAVIENLAIPELLRKLLHFGDVNGVEFYNIAEVFSRRIDPNREVIVVVDALDDRGEPFLGPLLKETDVGYRSIHDRLRTCGVFVVCLVRPESLTHCPINARNEPILASWNVSYLQYQLRQSFPDDYLEIERAIQEQRRKGRWSSEESDFRRQVNALIENRELRDVVTHGGVVATDPATDFPDDPLHVAVLYTATFYPNLSPHEFRRVLASLVGKKKMLVPEKVNQKTKEGTFKTVELQRERPVVDVWMHHADKVLRECGVITSDDARRGLTFAEIGRRDYLRKYFDEHYGLYVQSRFLAAYEKGLLFDPAEQVAKDVILLTLDMARSYGDHFGAEWLYELVTSAQQYENGWERMTDLLRSFLRDPDLSGLVSRTMKRLFDGTRHLEIFEICQRLRFTPGIVVLPMIRRLIDEGNEETRDKALRYLERELQQSGSIYPILRTLEAWLPDRTLDPAKYSLSAGIALRYVFKHVLRVTGGFDDRDRGKWPISFPPFAVVSDSARDDFTLLLNWLLHPHLQLFVGELPDLFDRYLPAVIAEWTFFLFGERAVASEEPERDSRALAAGSLTAEGAWTLLIERLVEMTATDRYRQQSLLDEWEMMRTVLAMAPSIVVTSVEREFRREFAWKRNLVRKLIGEFRRLQRELRVAPSSHRTRATA